MMNPTDEYCPWQPATVQARLRRRDENDAQCTVPYMPFVPLKEQPAVCHDEANFPGHADIQAAEVRIHALAASSLWTGDPPGESSISCQSARTMSCTDGFD